MGNAASLKETKGGEATPLFTVSITQNKERNDANKERGSNSSNLVDEQGNKRDDIQVHKNVIFTALRGAMDKIHKFPNLRDESGKWRKDLRDGLIALSKQIDAIENMDNLAYGVIQSYMRESGRLVLTSKTINIICSVVNVGWNIYYEDKAMNLDPDNFAVIKIVLKIIVSFSDSNDEVNCDIAKEEDFLKTLTKVLKTCYNSDIGKGEKGSNENILVFHSLIILYNISRVDENMKRLHSLNNVTIVALYLETVYRFVTLSYLANIINEDECAYLQGKDHAIETIKFLSDLLCGSIKHPLHQCTDDCNITWSAKECARLIRVLARNEMSKTLLVETGCSPHLVELARCGTVEEQMGDISLLLYCQFNANGTSLDLK